MCSSDLASRQSGTSTRSRSLGRTVASTSSRSLRSLSGRLALKLLSSPSQRAEAMGLALSRLFLEHQGVFQNQIVVPLDAHLELYKALRQNAEELGDEVNFRRTDLALFDLDPDPANRVITCRLVEVKCYSQVGNLSAYERAEIGRASCRERV